MAVPVPISSLIVEDWFHGLYTAGLLLTVWVILSNTSYSRERKTSLSALVIAMYICSTMHCSLQWYYYSKAINDNELPGAGPGLLNSLTHLAPWIEATGDTFFCFNILIADILFIWRCWMVWQRRWIVVILPIMWTTAGVAMAARFITAQVELETKPAVAFTAIKKLHDYVAFSTAYFALSIATSLFTTLFIALRIILVQRAWYKSMGVNRKHRRNAYSAAIEISVESAVLYSLTLLIFVILDVTKNVNAFYAQNIHAQMTGLAPMLIILRVAAGHSRPDTAWSTRIDPDIHTSSTNSTTSPGRGVISSIRFGPMGRGTTTTDTREYDSDSGAYGTGGGSDEADERVKERLEEHTKLNSRRDEGMSELPTVHSRELAV